MISSVMLKRRRCDVVVLKMHAPTDVQSDDTKWMFYEEL